MRETVLIADSHAERGRNVALACRGLGMAVHVVSHGAAALEYALAHKPLAMVCQLELPLIEGGRLVEILQTNPHTQGMGVLFVDDAAEGVAEGAGASKVVPGRADADTVARFLQALLARREPRPAPAREAAGPAIEGSLAQLELRELIELFHVNRKTGVIDLRHGSGRGAATGAIALEGGDVVQARTGSVEGEKAFFRLVRWRRGSFSFREGAGEGSRGIDRPTRALLRDAARQAEEWCQLGADLPPEHARVALSVARSSLPAVLHPLTQEVLLLLELSDRVQDVLDRSVHPDYQVLRTLQTLARRGMLEIRSEDPGAPRAAAGLLAPAVAARLRDWLDAGRAPGAPPVDAKVPVIAADATALEALGARLARLPGVGASRTGAAGLGPLLRIPVDADVGLELWRVPVAARYAPIWPLAAHGALATLFVHAGPIETSVEALRPAVDAVAGLPRARAFHLLLEDKEPAASERLCERLGLFDDRFVVRVPQERPEAGEAALRELLARLLP